MYLYEVTFRSPKFRGTRTTLLHAEDEQDALRLAAKYPPGWQDAAPATARRIKQTPIEYHDEVDRLIEQRYYEYHDEVDRAARISIEVRDAEIKGLHQRVRKLEGGNKVLQQLINALARYIAGLEV